MTITNYFSDLILTKDQQNAVLQFERFLNSNNSVFLLKGYAGTGKTTLIRGLIKYLKDLKYNTQLMAPTGRAAKIVQDKTGEVASTIHKGIYSFSELAEIKTGDEDDDLSFLYHYRVSSMMAGNSIIIIDEASMVSDVYSGQEFFRFGSGKVLEDLIQYSRINLPNFKTKILFVGDPAQLPPIGMNFSPALDKDYLIDNYKVSVESIELKEVKRLDKDNNILKKATKIREGIVSEYYNDFDLRENGKDIHNVGFENFIEAYKGVKGKKIVISFKNSTQNYVNQQIRIDKYGSDLPVQKGDVMIIGKNNYQLDLLNGEFALVNEISNDIISRAVRFNKRGGKGDVAEVVLKWRVINLIVRDDQNRSREVSGYLLENYLYGDGDLNFDEWQALYVDFMKRYPELKRSDKQFGEILLKDPYFNALMLKFGYAITCHKAQGGEWENIFVFWDKGISAARTNEEDTLGKSGKSNADFYRWAYTAITRSSQYLYCIEPPYFSPYSSMFFVDDLIQQQLEELNGDMQEDVVLVYSDEIKLLFHNLSLEACDASIQDHFLSVWYKLKSQNIAILSHCVKNYEVQYQFGKENEKVGLKFWFNGRCQFKPNFQNINSWTNSSTLFETISQLISRLPIVNLVRDDVELIETKIERDFSVDDRKPFLRNLEEELNNVIAVNKISIEEIGHLNYKERYNFIRGKEKAVLDIDYNNKGFFGRVTPLKKSCNSPLLLKDLQYAINQLKNQDYVVQRD